MRSALDDLLPDRDGDMWVQGEHVLAGILMIEAGGDKSGQAQTYMSQAMDAYKAILLVLTRDQSPEAWAQTQGELGNVAATLGFMSDPDKAPSLLELAIKAFKDALTWLTRKRAPEQWGSQAPRRSTKIRLWNN